MQGLKNYAGGAIVATVFMTIGALISHNSVSAAPPAKSTAPTRLYYLTPGNVNGNGALSACMNGYHMASFAEISDLSNLTYNNAVGRSAPDAGSGPPTYSLGGGWVRSGYSANADPTTPSSDVPTNCNLWASQSGSDYGEVAFILPQYSSTFQVFQSSSTVYFSNSLACDNSDNVNVGVWCVQN